MENMELKEMQKKVSSALDKLYKVDYFLFERSLCERCINHKFAIYLEQSFKEYCDSGYFVDCEYNKSHIGRKTNPKRASNLNGNYIDIIITKRDGNFNNDLVCFEVKKWNNYNDGEKDRKNLIILTRGDRFDYDFGFYIIFGKTREDTQIEVYRKGKRIK